MRVQEKTVTENPHTTTRGDLGVQGSAEGPVLGDLKIDSESGASAWFDGNKWVASASNVVWFWWQHGNYAPGEVTLGDCIRSAQRSADKTAPVEIERRIPGIPAEWVTYRFNAQNRLVPDIPQPKLIPLSHLPPDQKR